MKDSGMYVFHQQFNFAVGRSQQFYVCKNAKMLSKNCLQIREKLCGFLVESRYSKRHRPEICLLQTIALHKTVADIN